MSKWKTILSGAAMTLIGILILSTAGHPQNCMRAFGLLRVLPALGLTVAGVLVAFGGLFAPRYW